MKKLLSIGAIVVVVIVAAAFVLLGNINTLVKEGVEQTAPLVLKAPVELQSVDISVFFGSGELNGFRVGNPKGYKTDYAFNMKSLQVELDTASVTSDKIHIKSITIDAPDIVFEGGFKKSNLSQLQANAEAFAGGGGDKGKSADNGAGKKLQIDRLIIRNGTISVSMGLLQGKKLSVPLPTLELTDIGKDKDASAADVLKEVLAAVNGAAIPAVQQGVSKLGGVAKVREAVEGGVQKGLGKIKGLFGK